MSGEGTEYGHTTAEISTNAVNNSANLCANAGNDSYAVAWAIFAGVAGGLNLFLLIAVAKRWGILRQNVTYYYIVSCLLASILFCVLAVFEVMSRIHEFEMAGFATRRYDPTIPQHHSVMNRFAYRRAFVLALFVIIQLNIVSLIYGVSNNAYFVGRYSDPSPPPTTQFDIPIFNNNAKPRKRESLEVHAIRWKRVRAVFAIFFSWVLPLAITIPVPLGWNCIQYCACLPANSAGPYCFSETGSPRCSSLWHPMSDTFVFAVTGVWFLGMVTMFFLLARTILKFYRIHAPQESLSYKKPQRVPSTGLKWTRSNGERRSYIEKNDDNLSRSRSYHGRAQQRQLPAVRSTSFVSRHLRVGSLYNARVKSQKEYEKANNLATLPRDPKSATLLSTSRGLRRPLDPVVKMLIAISISSFVSVCPVVLILLLDVVFSIPYVQLVFNITLTITLLYFASLPFLLVKYMSGLLKAINNIIMACPCLRTVTVTRKSATPTRPAAVKTRHATGQRHSLENDGTGLSTLNETDKTDLQGSKGAAKVIESTNEISIVITDEVPEETKSAHETPAVDANVDLHTAGSDKDAVICCAEASKQQLGENSNKTILQDEQIEEFASDKVGDIFNSLKLGH